jgi:hypothetical protein
MVSARRCAPRPFGVALKGDRSHFVAASNLGFYVGGSAEKLLDAQLRPQFFCKRFAG